MWGDLMCLFCFFVVWGKLVDLVDLFLGRGGSLVGLGGGFSGSDTDTSDTDTRTRTPPTGYRGFGNGR